MDDEALEKDLMDLDAMPEVNELMELGEEEKAKSWWLF